MNKYSKAYTCLFAILGAGVKHTKSDEEKAYWILVKEYQNIIDSFMTEAIKTKFAEIMALCGAEFQGLN